MSCCHQKMPKVMSPIRQLISRLQHRPQHSTAWKSLTLQLIMKKICKENLKPLVTAKLIIFHIKYIYYTNHGLIVCSVDIEFPDGDVELITVDGEQDGEADTLTINKKPRRWAHIECLLVTYCFIPARINMFLFMHFAIRFVVEDSEWVQEWCIPNRLYKINNYDNNKTLD